MFNKIFIALILIFTVNSFIARIHAYETQYFIVTAYYSPLPNQSHYLRGSYEADIRLNGNGVKGASGVGVYNGMLAGPSKYPFGTKIYLEGFGTGTIADRGGAIVEAGERGYSYDRIDVWMGYGDEGLDKALTWGKRKVKGQIIEMGNGVALNNTSSTNNPNIYNINIGFESSKSNIMLLQKKLKELGLYKGELDGKYNNETVSILIKYQIENGIIKSKNDYGAGYWGAKTRKLFSTKEVNGFFNKSLVVNTTSTTKTENSTHKKAVITSTATTKDIFTTYVYPSSSKEDIKNLQTKLKELTFYKGDINGDYSSIKNILISYQLNKNIIKSGNEVGAGYFGPKTRETMKKDYVAYINQKEIDDKNKKKVDEIKLAMLNQASTTVEKIGTPKYGEVSQNVRELQKVLTTLGYFDGKDTAIYGDMTKQSVYNFQKDNKLVITISDPGAGKLGNKTKNVIKNELADLLVEKRLKEESAVAMNYKK
ncbi:MAG: peptidoglycan-binding protein [Candidatus Gracilibacteria bacterium]|nr:peptidoglycan-binding protein [Candidatus Gracilibacteria bacterium]